MSETDQPVYQVLARKYRPATFADLIGQEAMVRTLRNAFEADRIAHAFVMTGVRGVGKTTTARIIAKGLNCIGEDGTGGPTIQPCGTCGPCTAIAEGRHVDVLELDAASNTQVDKMREILAGVPYRPTEARYKIYIFDEVHMLSTSAFNALLKTLEEPPEHVKFIFATTEIRKVPVTVLSRCQRFDLRRIEPDVMIAHLSKIAQAEKADIDDDALALVTRAAEGSVRDALSLLDQAIAHGAGKTTVEEVRAMLGVADRARGLDLFELVMRGDAAGALGELSAQYAAGADPAAVIRDLAEITHWISMVKITPEAAEDPTVSPDARQRGAEMAQGLRMPVLTRAWQMLLKAMEEVSAAPNAMMAAEMALIRLTHVAELPPPGDLAAKLDTMAPPAAAPHGSAPQGGGGDGGPRAQLSAIPGGAAAAALAQPATPAPDPLARFARFEDVVALIRDRDIVFLMDVEQHLRLVEYRPGFIEFEPTPDAPQNLASTLGQRLQDWTGARWAVSVVSKGGAATLAEEKEAAFGDLVSQVQAHPLVQAALTAFPKAQVRDVITDHVEEDTNEDIVPIDPDEVDDDWEPVDPFE
ncbi:DNA polymerase-3 subunit gamma/tau [Rubricella aquisinus]|uniref:DNA polymerase III subunit gamma/tau n=1 Tax=Rubricella aquisinus TaxID=2028108 RepID=A0A840X2X0_9RHOB|nr:DNA polymerase III subunit gamma/tau [Rubricella aquisinus]MBB5516205.1 DNA polymerase-3 subunit gamma/tau [Rubricella aquisinus]